MEVCTKSEVSSQPRPLSEGVPAQDTLSNEVSRDISREIIGSFAVLASALFFYLSTIPIKLATGPSALDSTQFAFVRFFFGTMVFGAIAVWKRRLPPLADYHFVFARAISNVAALLTFFETVQLSSAAVGNLLNMTYPVFIAVFYIVFGSNLKKNEVFTYLTSLVAFIGIALVLRHEIQFGAKPLTTAFWGISSGILAALSIISLRLARQQNTTETVLFYMFGIGTILTFVLFQDRFVTPDGHGLRCLLACALCGVIGQYLLTAGSRYITAVENGVMSSARILFAVFVGPLFFIGEPSLDMLGILGALLIFGANLYLFRRRIIIE